ncbi:MAG: ABC transporter permease [Acidimicrobiia bacterium]|nr:ABC transporter permease [Acidimicrobiia bacterium]MDH5615625.1 ABC transporter permease [Acidimicrobiia bacterium]
MKPVAIARVNLVRFFRDRSAIFSVFLLPMLIVLLLGAMQGGASVPKLGFVSAADDALTSELLSILQGVDGFEAVEIDGEDSAVRQVERGGLQAAVIVPAGYESTLRSGGDVEIRLVIRAGQEVQGIGEVIGAVITRQATLLRTARFAAQKGAGTFDEALAVAEVAQVALPPVSVEATIAGEPFVLAGLGQFDIFAQGMLVLFIFLTTLNGAANLIQSRQLGVTRRMYSTPTPVRTMLAGEALSRFSIAIIQGAFIFIGTWLVFGVDWGSPIGSTLTIIAFALVSTSAAMLLGALVSNDQQAGGISTALGLGLAALGGCMFPLAVLEMLSDTVYRVAHVTPHAWALEAFQALVAEDAGVADIAGFLLILVGYAAVFGVLATWRLRKVLVR